MIVAVAITEPTAVATEHDRSALWALVSPMSTRELIMRAVVTLQSAPSKFALT